MHADAFAAEVLFQSLGITDWDWEVGKAYDYPSLEGRLELRPLDMAKIGQLVLDDGLWNGRRIVSEQWLRDAAEPVVTPDGERQRFGYLWGVLPASFENATRPVVSFAGWGSQFIHVIPDLDMVIVTTGGNQYSGKTFAIDGVLVRQLLPGVER